MSNSTSSTSSSPINSNQSSNSTKPPQIKSIKSKNWTITTSKGGMSNSMELDSLSSKLNLPKLPDMVYSQNNLSIKHSTGAMMEFTPEDALKFVQIGDLGHRVSMASHWTKMSQEEHEDIVNIHNPFDWTFTTEYSGTASPEFHTKNTGEIDLDLLKRHDPILFYDEVVLYEDELADNGHSSLYLKVRVMPTCFLVLLRFFLRVDQVRFYIRDTRIFNNGNDELVRQIVTREANYQDVMNKAPKTREGIDVTKATDMEWIISHIKPVESIETLYIK